MFSDLLDDADDFFSSSSTKLLINNGNKVLMQPKVELQPTTQTKMVPIAPRYDPNQYNSSITQICSTCNQPIYERYFLHTQDRFLRANYYHMHCLRCQCCDVILADISSTFYTKDNTLLCKSDYLKKYGSRPCSLCSQIIGTNEQIMRINSNYVYHLSCFTCVKCHTPLVKGDRYVLFNGQPYCEKDNPTKILNPPLTTKRGSTTTKRGAKSARTNNQIQQPTFLSIPQSSQYHPTGQMSLLTNPSTTNTITHSLLTNTNPLTSSNTDDLY